MDFENVSQTIIEKDVSDELIWITVSKYALFMSYGRVGIDAKALYEHYQFTCILQKTNSVWAADKYCRQGLDWGRDRFENAKRLLIDLGLIEINQVRNESGKFDKIYIKVKMKKVELEPIDLDRLTENRQADLPASGKTTTNALTKKRNALTKKKKMSIPPTNEEVNNYIKENDYLITAEDFIDCYAARGWMIGKQKMKDWKAALRTFVKNDMKWNPDKYREKKSIYGDM